MGGSPSFARPRLDRSKRHERSGHGPTLLGEQIERRASVSLSESYGFDPNSSCQIGFDGKEKGDGRNEAHGIHDVQLYTQRRDV